MYSLIYVGTATRSMSESELAELLEQCRRNNARLGITGMLLYKDGDFMQVLEGEEQTVKELYARVWNDPRHRLITLIIEKPIEKRSFGDWTMGFRILHRADLQKDPGFSDFLDRRFNDKNLVTVDLATKLLTYFSHH